MLKFMRSQESVVFKKSPIHGFQHKLCTARQNNLQTKMYIFCHPIVSEGQSLKAYGDDESMSVVGD